VKSAQSHVLEDFAGFVDLPGPIFAFRLAIIGVILGHLRCHGAAVGPFRAMFYPLQTWAREISAWRVFIRL